MSTFKFIELKHLFFYSCPSLIQKPPAQEWFTYTTVSPVIALELSPNTKNKTLTWATSLPVVLVTYLTDAITAFSVKFVP